MIMLLMMNEEHGIEKHAPLVDSITIPFLSVGKELQHSLVAKDHLNSMKGSRLRRYGGRKPTAFIVIEMAIKEPLVGGSIQSSALKTKCSCVNQEEQLLNKKNHLKEVTHSHS